VKFEWDAKKSTGNLKKHGVSFERAQYAFADPHRIIEMDKTHSQNEPRFFCYGEVDGGYSRSVLPPETETSAFLVPPIGEKEKNAMNKKPEFTKEGYQKDLKDIGGEPLPRTSARRVSKKEVDELGISSPDKVLQALRSKPARGTPSRTENTLPARKVLRLNQRDFAKLIGTSPAAVRNWEQGRTRIPPMAKKLMHVVQRHPDVPSELTEVDSR
jgi:DNA-binding transcriptional regulator YiaG